MSFTALAVLCAYLLGILMAFVGEPIFALFSYLWIFYNDPATHWWGADLPSFRYSLFAALMAFIVIIRMRTRPAAAWSSMGGFKILLAYALWMWLQTLWAIDVGIHIEGAILFTKYVALTYVIFNLTATQRGLELFVWAHVVGCFLFGWEAFRTDVAGRLETIGGPGVDDSNLLAAHVLTGLICAGFLFVGLKGVKRWLLFLMLPFIMNTIILTQSRGAFLSLSAAGVAAWYLAPRAHRKFVAISGMLAVAMLFVLANQEFWDRISSLLESQETAVTETRFQIIGPQLEMFRDYPWGVGHRGNEILSPQYMPPELLSEDSARRGAHNTFMASLVDQGLPGGILLFSLYAWGFLQLIRLKRLDKLDLPPILGTYRAALGASLASLFVSGLFLNLLKTEVQVWLLAGLASLIVMANQAVADKLPVRSRRRVAGVARGNA